MHGIVPLPLSHLVLRSPIVHEYARASTAHCELRTKPSAGDFNALGP